MQKMKKVVVLLLLILFFPMPGILFAASPNEIANVDGVSISTVLFEKRMSRLTGEGQGNFNTYEGKKELLDLLIAREVLNQEGRRRGIEKSTMVRERIEEMTKELVINEVVNTIIREKVTEPAMKAYYKKNQSDFGEVRANHILVKTEDEAKEVKKKLDGGADFAALAKEVSIDPASAARGGDLGFFTRERMVESFSDAAFSMKIDEISKPVKSNFGYHIIQVKETRAPNNFEALTPAQLQNLRGSMINWEIDRLKKKASIKVNDAALRKAANAPLPQSPGGASSGNH